MPSVKFYIHTQSDFSSFFATVLYVLNSKERPLQHVRFRLYLYIKVTTEHFSKKVDKGVFSIPPSYDIWGPFFSTHSAVIFKKNYTIHYKPSIISQEKTPVTSLTVHSVHQKPRPSVLYLQFEMSVLRIVKSTTNHLYLYRFIGRDTLTNEKTNTSSIRL